MKRAYSVFEIKGIDEEKRIIEGIATTPKTDRVGDIVEPEGAEYKLPLPFLWQHRSDQPVGHVTRAKVSADGITVQVQILKFDEPGQLKDRLDLAWHSIKTGLVRGLSIGFAPIEAADIKGTWGQRFIKWNWVELSGVTIPANEEATITSVKSYDLEAPAASGTVTKSKPPGVSGPVKLLKPKHERDTVTLKEQIKQFEATRQAKAARMAEIMTKSGETGETLDATLSEEYDTLEAELVEIDKHLVRLNKQEQINKNAAKPVDDPAPAPQTRTVAHVTVKPAVEKGSAFVRHAIALAVVGGNRYEAAQYAKSRWPDHTEVQALITTDVDQLIKAAVAAGTTTDATWAGPLAVVTPLQNEFLELLRPATLLGKLQGLRNVPFNISLPAVTSGGSVAWVGQGNAKPVSALALSTVTLDFAKAAGIVVLTQELTKLSTPSAEAVVRDTMIDTMRVFMDTQFVDSTVAAVAGVNPASVTNGVTGFAASGTTEAAARTDLRALVKSFATNLLPLGGVVLLMSEDVAFVLGTMVNAVGAPAFPGITINGGNILGIPVITSNVVGNQIVAVHAPSVLYADDGQTAIDVSREATVQMDSAPDNPTTSATVLVSLWQRNLIGLRFERYMNWKKARTNVVNRITAVAYA